MPGDNEDFAERKLCWIITAAQCPWFEIKFVKELDES